MGRRDTERRVGVWDGAVIESQLPESGIASRVLSVQRAWVGRRG